MTGDLLTQIIPAIAAGLAAEALKCVVADYQQRRSGRIEPGSQLSTEAGPVALTSLPRRRKLRRAP